MSQTTFPSTIMSLSFSSLLFLPSTVTLVTYLFVPYYARRSLHQWRAIQVYERQPITITGRDRKVTRAGPGLVDSAVLLLLIASIPVTAVASTENWKESAPDLFLISQAVPDFVIFLIVMDLFRKLPEHLQVLNDGKVYRSASDLSDHHGEVIVGPVDSIHHRVAVGKFDRLFHFITIIFASLAFIQASEILSTQAPIFITSLWAAFASRRAQRFHSAIFDTMELGLFVFVPILFGVFGVLLRLCILFLDYLLQPITPEEKTEILMDLTASRMSVIFFSFATQFLAMIPCYMLCLAYRFDAANAGLTKVDTKEAEEIILQSTQNFDQWGRRPIKLSSVAVPTSKLSQTPFPTFKAAYGTMLLIQVLGVCVEGCTKWNEEFIYATHEDHIPAQIGYPFPSSLMIYPAVIIAMVASVRYTSKSKDFTSLWAYNEVWIPKSYRDDFKNGPFNRDPAGELIIVNIRALQTVVRFCVRNASCFWCAILHRVGLIIHL